MNNRVFRVGDAVIVEYGGVKEKGEIFYKHEPEQGCGLDVYTVLVRRCVYALYHESEIILDSSIKQIDTHKRR